jgi:hypothetical protein
VAYLQAEAEKIPFVSMLDRAAHDIVRADRWPDILGFPSKIRDGSPPALLAPIDKKLAALNKPPGDRGTICISAEKK